MNTFEIPISYQGDENAVLSVRLYPIPYQSDEYAEKRFPAVLICPGGGYGALSPREGEAAALAFRAAGFHTAVLSYSLEEKAVFPRPLTELALSVAYLKEHAEEWNIDTERIFVCGFSAGGHLALSLGAFWHEAFLSEKTGGINNELFRPAGLILSYPVVGDDFGGKKQSTIRRCLGEEPYVFDPAMTSPVHFVSDKTPPTFLWTTYSDKTVPCEHSLALASALREKGVLLEFHLFGWGAHGSSLCTPVTEHPNRLGAAPSVRHAIPHNAVWLKLCLEWIDFFFPEQA